MVLKSQNNKNITVTGISKLTVDELKAELSIRKVAFDSGILKTDLVKLMEDQFALDQNAPAKDVKDVEAGKPLSADQLKKLAEKISTDAKAINDEIAKLKTSKEVETFLEGYTGNNSLVDYAKKVFFAKTNGVIPMDSNGGLQVFASGVASDSPNSEIIKNVPVRVIEQAILTSSEQVYPLNKLIRTETVRNGLKQLFYKDFRDTDTKSGYEDVAISDYNMGTEPIFTEVKQVDTNIHKGYDVLDSMLNDITIDFGLFVSLLHDSILALARPIAKRFYIRFIDFLNDSDSYDEIKSFTASADAKTKAKEFFTHITSIATVSRTNLKKTPTGSTQALEKAILSSNLHLVINAKYQAGYIFDFSANVFQIGQTKIQFKSLSVLDFDKIDAYKTSSGDILKTNELIFMEDGAYNEIVHFDGTKEVNTPKLKRVVHRYVRVGNFRTSDKYIGAYKKKLTQ